MTWNTRWVIRQAITGLALVAAIDVCAQSCPEAMAHAPRLILVTAPSMHTSAAQLQLFERTRTDALWSQIGDPEPAVIGQAGMAWGHTYLSFGRDHEPIKVEGDRRTPAGIFRIGSSFGFAKSALQKYVVLKAGETVCVDDPSSPLYNKIASRSQIAPGVSREEMWRIPLYRRGLFVDYPTDRANRRGSCIFIHIWGAADKGTTGCVALPEMRVAALQNFTEAGATLAVLPEHALDRFGECLPSQSASKR
jgi:D-alanyl-D-alanine dipeptidase